MRFQVEIPLTGIVSKNKDTPTHRERLPPLPSLCLFPSQANTLQNVSLCREECRQEGHKFTDQTYLPQHLAARRTIQIAQDASS